LYEKGVDQPLIIAVTGHTEQQYVKKAICSGMNQVFTKPVRGDLIKELVTLIGYPN
jgi:CheY-like chemotaxis protein